MSRLLSVPSSTGAKGEKHRCSCAACGRVFANPIRLTNLSALPNETYSACPFCFSRLAEYDSPEEVEGVGNSDSSPLTSPTRLEESQTTAEPPPGGECPHYFGYLKKRPKNSAFPDCCLTCEKMIQCLL